MTDFRHYNDATLRTFWNEDDGSLSWRIALEDELVARGYATRATGPEDNRPRLSGERVRLEASDTPPPVVRDSDAWAAVAKAGRS